MINLLVERGADVNRRYAIATTDRKETKTVLFETATGSTVEFLLQKGADVHAKNSWNETPLHCHAYRWRSSLVQVLVSRGADVNAVKSNNNITPLEAAILRKPSKQFFDDEEFLEVCRILLRSNATISWSTTDEFIQTKMKADRDPDTVRARAQLVYEWVAQRDKGDLSFTLPIEIFRRGAFDIATYFAALKRSSQHFAVLAKMKRVAMDALRDYRSLPAKGLFSDVSTVPKQNTERPKSVLYSSQVCVVGPRQCGKTSFIRSFTADASKLEPGISLTPWSFDVKTDAGLHEYEVSLWNIPGREEYRATHMLFSTRPTLYLLCIDVGAYYEELDAATNSANNAIDDKKMNDFADEQVFKWVRMACALDPHAEFAFVGTKADLVEHDPSKILAVQHDVVLRFQQSVNQRKERVQSTMDELIEFKNEIQDCDSSADTNELKIQIEHCRINLDKQPVLLSEDLIVFTTADAEVEAVTQEKLKTLLTRSTSPMLLPPGFGEVLKFIQQSTIKQQRPTFKAKVDTAFRSVTEFVDSITQAASVNLSTEEVRAALHFLHATGDIMWFDDDNVLGEKLFLDPTFVVELIRQLFNHSVLNEFEDGVVDNKWLQTLPSWKEIGSKLPRMKYLLFHLQLAYPVKIAEKVAWDSDLIVPMYWKRACADTSIDKTFPTEAEKAAGLTQCVKWEYIFEGSMDLFEKLAVATYTQTLSAYRSCRQSSFIDKQPGKYVCQIAIEESSERDEPPDRKSVV